MKVHCKEIATLSMGFRVRNRGQAVELGGF